MVIFRNVMRIVMAVLFILAGVNHFRNPDFYLNIMPEYIPMHYELVIASGVTEIIAGIMLLIPPLIFWGGLGVIEQLLAFMPVHIDMIVNYERYAEAVGYPFVWIRIVLQAVFLYWAYWAAVKHYWPGKEEAKETT